MSNVSELIEVYLTIRRERETLALKDKELVEDMERIESKLLAICNDQNVSGLKTPFGTVTRSVKELSLIHI